MDIQTRDMYAAVSQLEFSVNLAKGIIYLEGEMDTYTAPFFIERVNIIRDFRPSDKKDDPIDLYITSPGGDLNALTALVDLIEGVSCKINTFGVGHVESAAVWVLAAGTGTRYIAPNTEVMVHEIATWLRGSTSDVENEAKQIKIKQKNLYDLLGKYSKKEASFWRDLVEGKKNLYMLPQTCIEHGLVDKLIEPNTL